MAGFSLGRGGASSQDEEIPPDSLFLYAGGAGSSRHEEIAYSRGFELWQQRQQQQHQPHHHIYPSAGLLGFSCDDPSRMQAGGSSSAAGGKGRGSASGSGGGGGGGTISCQDCGNQAKKDCSHLRCRTCCKSRGFQCSTHVKSTWVPASKRRERQQQLSTTAPRGAEGGGEPSKRPREICTARLPTTITTTTGEGMNFPTEVSSPAVFRCVRVSPMDEAEDEYAYQTAVTIGGHMFKGILYDQGPDGAQSSIAPHHGESSSSAAGAVISAASITAPVGLMDSSLLYPAPLSAFMAGTQFFPHHPRP